MRARAFVWWCCDGHGVALLGCMGTMPSRYGRAGAASSPAGEIRGLTRDRSRVRLEPEVTCRHLGYVPIVSRLLSLLRHHVVDDHLHMPWGIPATPLDTFF